MSDEQAPLTNPFENLPPGTYEAMQGLMYLGYIEETTTFCGHEFTLRTLKMSEQLEAALIAKEYLDSIGQVYANAWSIVAASLVAVDGDTNFCPPIGPSVRGHIRGKFQHIVDNWYPPTGNYLYEVYTGLLAKQQAVIEAVENLSQRSLSTSWRSPDSLEQQASLPEN